MVLLLGLDHITTEPTPGEMFRLRRRPEFTVTNLESVNRGRKFGRISGKEYLFWTDGNMFIQQSTEYIQQIEAEIERLQQLLGQVRLRFRAKRSLRSKSSRHLAHAQPRAQGR